MTQFCVKSFAKIVRIDKYEKSENTRYAKILWENIYEKSANSWVSKTQKSV